MVAIFTSLNELNDLKQYEAMERIIKRVLMECCEKSDPTIKEPTLKSTPKS